MTTPEPLDETPAGGVEQRGGNSPVDYIRTPVIAPGAQHACVPGDGGCSCEDED